MANGTLHVLGDSFAECWPLPFRSWSRMVADGLGMDVSNQAAGGSSLPHLFGHQWPRAMESMGQGDVVIACITSPHRTWFFPERHSISALSSIDESASNRTRSTGRNDEGPGYLDEYQTRALKNYYVYLHRDELHLSWLRSWLAELDQTCGRVGARAVVLDCFGPPDDPGSPGRSTIEVSSKGLANITRGVGHLNRVAMGELANPRTEKYVASNTDPRVNHLGMANHGVLAAKVIDSLVNGTPIDLYSGFKYFYIDSARFLDESYMLSVVCDTPWCQINGKMV